MLPSNIHSQCTICKPEQVNLTETSPQTPSCTVASNQKLMQLNIPTFWTQSTIFPKKSKIQKSVILYRGTLTKFQLPSFIFEEKICTGVILIKSSFCEKYPKFDNFCQNFTKFLAFLPIKMPICYNYPNFSFLAIFEEKSVPAWFWENQVFVKNTLNFKILSKFHKF